MNDASAPGAESLFEYLSEIGCAFLYSFVRHFQKSSFRPTHQFQEPKRVNCCIQRRISMHLTDGWNRRQRGKEVLSGFRTKTGFIIANDCGEHSC